MQYLVSIMEMENDHVGKLLFQGSIVHSHHCEESTPTSFGGDVLQNIFSLRESQKLYPLLPEFGGG